MNILGKTAGRAYIFEAESAILEKACEIIHETPLSLRDISPEGEKKSLQLKNFSSFSKKGIFVNNKFSPPSGGVPEGQGGLNNT